MRTQAYLVAVLMALLPAQGCAMFDNWPIVGLPRIDLSPQRSLAYGGIYFYEKEKHTNPAEGLAKDFADVSSQCKGVLEVYYLNRYAASTPTILLALVGAVAGGVGVPMLVAAAPAANQVPIAALGGISGVTNALQSSLKAEGITSADIRTQLDQLRSVWTDAVKGYATSTKLEDKVAYLRQAAGACLSYATIHPLIRVSTGSD